MGIVQLHGMKNLIPGNKMTIENLLKVLSKEPEIVDVIPKNYQLTFEPNLTKFTFSGSEVISAFCKKPAKQITMDCAELKIISCVVTSKGKVIGFFCKNK